MSNYTKGIAGIFLTEEQIIKAATQTRDAGYKQFEAITPYPLHGMEEACGVKRSFIPYIAFTAAVIGLSLATWFMWWTSAVSWPINIGGKPLFSLPAFIPVMFELTVLFAALSSVGTLIYVCGLPMIDPPIIDPDLTSHKFAVFISEKDQSFDAAKIEAMFKSLGASEVKRTEF
jgi:Protein of unknown function (DUF3341)